MSPSPRFPQCTALDLYGARCSLLHTRTTESRKSKEGKANKLLYAFGDHTTAELKSQIDFANWNALPVHANDLLASAEHGLVAFDQYLDTNPDHAAIVRQKAGQMLPTGDASMKAVQRHNEAFELILREIDSQN